MNYFECSTEELIVTPPSISEELIVTPLTSLEELIVTPLSSLDDLIVNPPSNTQKIFLLVLGVIGGVNNNSPENIEEFNSNFFDMLWRVTKIIFGIKISAYAVISRSLSTSLEKPVMISRFT